MKLSAWGGIQESRSDGRLASRENQIMESGGVICERGRRIFKRTKIKFSDDTMGRWVAHTHIFPLFDIRLNKICQHISLLQILLCHRSSI